MSIECQQITNCGVNDGGVGVVDRKIQGYDTVATVDGLEGASKVAAFAESLIVPHIFIAYGHIFVKFVSGIYRHREWIGCGLTVGGGVHIVDHIRGAFTNVVGIGALGGEGQALHRRAMIPLELAARVVAFDRGC